MEVIGAAASVIAIGQAVAAVPKIVRLLRSVPNAKIEVASLLNEVSFEYYSNSSFKAPGNPPPKPHHRDADSIVTRLARNRAPHICANGGSAEAVGGIREKPAGSRPKFVSIR